jgi:hypothetical protein
MVSGVCEKLKKKLYLFGSGGLAQLSSRPPPEHKIPGSTSAWVLGF